MIIKAQPADLAYARSPILYLVNDVNYPNDGFRYIAQVYIWEGAYASRPATPQYKIYRTPLVSGDGYFDFSTLAESAFQIPSIEEPSEIRLGGFALNMQIDFGYFDDISGEVLALATSNRTICLDGYTLYTDGLNFGDITYEGGTKQIFMTDLPEQFKVLYGIPFRFGVYYDDKFPIRYVRLFDDDGNQYQYDLLSIIGIPTSPPDQILSFQCGYGVEWIDNTTGSGNVPFPLDPINYYYIQGLDNAGTTVVTKTYRFEIDADLGKQPGGDCLPYGNYPIKYLNKYGYYDAMNFVGRQTVRNNMTREEYQTTPIDNDSGALFYFRQYGQFEQEFINTVQTDNVNTGWLAEAFNEPLRQMLNSEQVLTNEAEPLPLLPTDEEFTFRTQRSEKLINYAFNFKRAYEYINSVR